MEAASHVEARVNNPPGLVGGAASVGLRGAVGFAVGVNVALGVNVSVGDGVYVGVDVGVRVGVDVGVELGVGVNVETEAGRLGDAGVMVSTMVCAPGLLCVDVAAAGTADAGAGRSTRFCTVLSAARSEASSGASK